MKNKSGFTLLELIVVLAILGIILAIAVPNYLGIHVNADNNAQTVQAGLIAQSLQQEFADNYAHVNETPDPSELLVVLTNPDTKVVGFKVDDTLPVRGHLCFTYIKASDTPAIPYFEFTIDDATDTLTINYKKSGSETLTDLATVHYY